MTDDLSGDTTTTGSGAHTDLVGHSGNEHARWWILDAWLLPKRFSS